MNADETRISKLAKLREPFPKSEIRHLPRVWCKACRDSRAGCNRHRIIECGKCGNKISSAHIDLRYVGHAEATNRLLNVDPEWSWEPVAFDEKGLPQYDANGGLWIRLTVCGVTRLGYGHAEGKRGGDAVKEIIGDAIRNAGIRFGMALDLWTSSDLEIAENGPKSDQSAPDRHLRSVQPGEADPWATPAPQQQTAPQGRDYLHEAHQAADTDTVRGIYRQAVAAGAALEYLAQIAEVGRQKASAEQSVSEAVADDGYRAVHPDDVEVIQAGPTPYSMTDATAAEGAVHTDAELYAALESGHPEVEASAAELLTQRGQMPVSPQQAQAASARSNDDHAAAVAELKAFAAQVGIADIEADAHGALGAPLEAVSAAAIRRLLAQLRGTAA